jgi:predicted ATPase
LPGTPALRRDQIKLQVALITPLTHVKGYLSPETTNAVERARLLIEQAEGRGEPLEDPLLLFSALHAHWIANIVAFNGDIACDLAKKFLALATDQKNSTTPLMLGHRVMGTSPAFTGHLVDGLAHHNQAIALYRPDEHRALTTRFGQDHYVAVLCFRSQVLWPLGYPAAALADASQALTHARSIGQAATLIFACNHVSFLHLLCRDYERASLLLDELSTLSDEKSATLWKAVVPIWRGILLAQTGRARDAIQVSAGLSVYRASGGTYVVPYHLLNLATAHAELGQFEDAWHHIEEATAMLQTTKQLYWESEVDRLAGEIARKMPEPDIMKALAYFDRALAVARQQKAKSWELRAAMSMARLWRDQGKREAARELLAPVYGWFTEGFDTRDLKEAKALLEQLAA